jgi:hypothetical protein
LMPIMTVFQMSFKEEPSLFNKPHTSNPKSSKPHPKEWSRLSKPLHHHLKLKWSKPQEMTD